MSGTTRHSRFTALTCLFCALNVYRVHHVISLDVEGNETTLLPSEDWVEREILKSGTGWIDVHKDCLVRNLSPSSTFNTMNERSLLPTALLQASKGRGSKPFILLNVLLVLLNSCVAYPAYLAHRSCF